ncbi:hypothetical protein [Methylibium sp.]|uniref:hypothetical protein n=1 Tax=Methylibium sp. TaxID=2067992 RepID=UPI0017C3C821|nr:hypothetical protein [Methylibium sp.]MBA3590682.1 hypothetical protein [Methylibium sp.]
MRTLLLPLLLVLALPLGAAEPATANEPHYEDRSLWPADVGKRPHMRQVWPATRVLTWAKPGVSALKDDKPFETPSFWLEDGKPATKPIDGDCALVLPAMPPGGSKGRYYIVQEAKKNPVPSIRHLTVGAGVTVVWLHSSTGNTWVKKGGELNQQYHYSGDKDSFFRNDNPVPQQPHQQPVAGGPPLYIYPEGERNQLAHPLQVSSLIPGTLFRYGMNDPEASSDHVYFVKAPNASLEVIGRMGCADSFHFKSGTVIISDDSALIAAARGTLGVSPGATLELHSGAAFSKLGNQHGNVDLTIKGRFLAGTVDRPLVRDCFLGVSWKGKRRFMSKDNEKALDGRAERSDDASFIVTPEGTLEVHSADPAKARLIIDWNGRPIIEKEIVKTIGHAENYAKLKEEPPLIDLLLVGTLKIDGLVINHLAKGGLVLADPAQVKQWKHVTWGPDCAGPLVELVRKWDGKPTFAFTNAGGDY